MKSTKYCPDCSQERPVGDFTRNVRNKDGLAFYCTPCRRARETASRRRRFGPPRQRVAPPGVPAGFKWCPDCGVIKPHADFPLNVTQRNGLGTYCKPCHNRITRANRVQRNGSVRNYHLRRRYGITAEHFDQMLAQQNGVCAICEEAPAVHVDHDHETKRVRGLLCFNCNGALGQFRDRTDLMVKAVAYLEPALFGPAVAAGATLGAHLYLGPRPEQAPSPLAG